MLESDFNKVVGLHFSGWRIPGPRSHVWVPAPEYRVPGSFFRVCLMKHKLKKFRLNC